jgi:hypothetical protein
MDNVTCAVKGDLLTITVDLKKAGKKSKTGKTLLVATTNGAVPVEHSSGAKVSINVMVPNPDYQG